MKRKLIDYIYYPNYLKYMNSKFKGQCIICDSGCTYKDEEHNEPIVDVCLLNYVNPKGIPTNQISVGICWECTTKLREIYCLNFCKAPFNLIYELKDIDPERYIIKVCRTKKQYVIQYTTNHCAMCMLNNNTKILKAFKMKELQ